MPIFTMPTPDFEIATTTQTIYYYILKIINMICIIIMSYTILHILQAPVGSGTHTGTLSCLSRFSQTTTQAMTAEKQPQPISIGPTYVRLCRYDIVTFLDHVSLFVMSTWSDL